MELEARDASQTTNKMNDAFSLLEQLAQWVTHYLCTHHPEGGYAPFLESLLLCMQKWQSSYNPRDQVVQWKFLSLLTSFTINVIAIFPFFRKLKPRGLKWLAHNHTTLSETWFRCLYASESFYSFIFKCGKSNQWYPVGFCVWSSDAHSARQSGFSWLYHITTRRFPVTTMLSYH